MESGRGASAGPCAEGKAQTGAADGAGAGTCAVRSSPGSGSGQEESWQRANPQPGARLTAACRHPRSTFTVLVTHSVLPLAAVPIRTAPRCHTGTTASPGSSAPARRCGGRRADSVATGPAAGTGGWGRPRAPPALHLHHRLFSTGTGAFFWQHKQSNYSLLAAGGDHLWCRCLLPDPAPDSKECPVPLPLATDNYTSSSPPRTSGQPLSWTLGTTASALFSPPLM